MMNVVLFLFCHAAAQCFPQYFLNNYSEIMMDAQTPKTYYNNIRKTHPH